MVQQVRPHHGETLLYGAAIRKVRRDTSIRGTDNIKKEDSDFRHAVTPVNVVRKRQKRMSNVQTQEKNIK